MPSKVTKPFAIGACLPSLSRALGFRQALSLDVTQMFTGLHSYDAPSIGLGWDIETGGHVFQLNLVNSGWLSEDRAYTRGGQGLDHFSTWCLGFHITRAFDFGG